jgi:hypothetical protein
MPTAFGSHKPGVSGRVSVTARGEIACQRVLDAGEDRRFRSGRVLQGPGPWAPAVVPMEVGVDRRHCERAKVQRAAEAHEVRMDPAVTMSRHVCNSSWSRTGAGDHEANATGGRRRRQTKKTHRRGEFASGRGGAQSPRSQRCITCLGVRSTLKTPQCFSAPPGRAGLPFQGSSKASKKNTEMLCSDAQASSSR